MSIADTVFDSNKQVDKIGRALSKIADRAVPVLLLSMVSVGCGVSGTHSPQQSGPTVLTMGTGSWDMQDVSSGHVSHFELIPVANVGCESGDLLDMHITKEHPEDYWEVGLAGAEIHWIMRRNPNGDYQAVASQILWDTSVSNPHPKFGVLPYPTIDYVFDTYSYGGNNSADAYLVMPGTYSGPVTRYGGATWWDSNDQVTNDCIKGTGTLGPDTPWTSVITMQNVDTPVYFGPAIANDEYEGCHPDNLNCGAAHETWYFAPGIGLVEINALWEGVDIKRIPPALALH